MKPGRRVTPCNAFLSTLPARGATFSGRWVDEHKAISIHAPREGSDPCRPHRRHGGGISIHAPREGSDLCRRLRPEKHADFYPRSPRGERPRTSTPRPSNCNFYPRSPRGERPPACGFLTTCLYFYPRSPRGERPRPCLVHRPVIGISIHAPREGSDAAALGSRIAFI